MARKSPPLQDRRTNAASKAPASSRYARRKVSTSSGVTARSSARVSSPNECAVPPTGRAESANCNNRKSAVSPMSIVYCHPFHVCGQIIPAQRRSAFAAWRWTNRARIVWRCSGTYFRSLYAAAFPSKSPWPTVFGMLGPKACFRRCRMLRSASWTRLSPPAVIAGALCQLSIGLIRSASATSTKLRPWPQLNVVENVAIVSSGSTSSTSKLLNLKIHRKGARLRPRHRNMRYAKLHKLCILNALAVHRLQPRLGNVVKFVAVDSPGDQQLARTCNHSMR